MKKLLFTIAIVLLCITPALAVNDTFVVIYDDDRNSYDPVDIQIRINEYDTGIPITKITDDSQGKVYIYLFTDTNLVTGFKVALDAPMATYKYWRP